MDINSILKYNYKLNLDIYIYICIYEIYISY